MGLIQYDVTIGDYKAVLNGITWQIIVCVFMHSYLKDMVWKPIEIGFCYDLYQRTGRNKLQKMGC